MRQGAAPGELQRPPGGLATWRFTGLLPPHPTPKPQPQFPTRRRAEDLQRSGQFKHVCLGMTEKDYARQTDLFDAVFRWVGVCGTGGQVDLPVQQGCLSGASAKGLDLVKALFGGLAVAMLCMLRREPWHLHDLIHLSAASWRSFCPAAASRQPAP